MTTSARWLWAVLGLLASVLGLARSAEARQAEAVPVSPDVVLRDIASAYAGGVVAERVVVRVTDGFAQTRGEYTFRTEPGRGLLLELGSLHVWCKGDAIVVAHAQNLSGYVQFDPAPGQSLGELLGQSLPPIPCPQAALLLGDADLERPTPFTPGVEWVEGQVSAGVVRLLGVGDGGASLELRADAETSRLTSLVANFNEDDGRRLELKVTPIDPGGLDPLSVNLDDRERETKVGRLAPHPGDSTESRRMPPMRLMPAPALLGEGGGPGGAIEFADHGAGPPGVYVFVRGWTDEARLAMEAAREVGKRTGEPVVPVYVGELSSDASWREGLLTVGDGVGGMAKLYASLAPELTIERFSPSAAAVLARTDAGGVCTHLEIIAPGEGVGDKGQERLAQIIRRMTK